MNALDNWGEAQQVWSPVYVDAMIARDRDADASGGNGLEERLYAVHDANFNVTALVNTAGSVVERYRYTPYGTPTVLDANAAADADGLSDVEWRYLHQGGRYDPAAGAGLYHFRHRDYDPALGRWLQQDPAGYVDGSNLYEYEGSLPATSLDPAGLFLIPSPPAAVAAGEAMITVAQGNPATAGVSAAVLIGGSIGYGIGTTVAKPSVTGVMSGALRRACPGKPCQDHHMATFPESEQIRLQYRRCVQKPARPCRD